MGRAGNRPFHKQQAALVDLGPSGRAVRAIVVEERAVLETPSRS